MKTGRSSVVLAAVAVVAAIALASGLRLFAQTQAPATSGGSLAEVAAEIRLLRIALEENGNKQTLASMLAAQQGRLQPFLTQLAEIGKYLEEATIASRQAQRSVVALQAQLATAPASQAVTTQAHLKEAQGVAEAAAFRESLLRDRVTEITQAMQREEAVWIDLMNRLQQAIKR